MALHPQSHLPRRNHVHLHLPPAQPPRTGAALAVVAIPAAAHAATLDVTYDAVGTAHIASTGSSIDLASTQLHTTIDADTGAITGSMPLTGTRTEFKIAGLLPVSANVNFVEAAPITGSLNRIDRTTTVTTEASYYIRLSNVWVGGLPTFNGFGYCQTEEPVIIPANTPEGEVFNITTGGPLEGTFSIGDFENCGFNTLLINQIIPGNGNTVELDISNGRLG